MPIPTPPVVGQSQLASRYVLEVGSGQVPVFGMSSFVPNLDYVTFDNTDFDSGLLQTQGIAGFSATLNFTVKDKLYTAAMDPGQALLKAAAEPGQGGFATLPVRWYDKAGVEKAKFGEAYIQWQPQGGSNTDESTTNVVALLQSYGTEPNPLEPTDNPSIASYQPSTGAKAGELLTIIGAHFLTVTGPSGVQIDNGDATYSVESDSRIVVAVPAGVTSGSADVDITNGNGSTNDSYTFG